MNCEIEFLPVGDASKAGDAIVVRYGWEQDFRLILIDGGHGETGEQIVAHLRRYFGPNPVLEHVILTHSDADHASGLRAVLREIKVQNLWLHVPWLAADPALFQDARWTLAGLQAKIMGEYDIVSEIIDLAAAAGCNVYQPFTGQMIGPLRVLSPSLAAYRYLVPQFDRTPDPNRDAIQAVNMWIGKESLAGKLFELAKASVQSWTTESWDNERLKDGGITSASNESSLVLYGDFGDACRVLLTGDAGVSGLTWAALEADRLRLPLQRFTFVQVPHHGSRRNVGPSILTRLLGPPQAQWAPSRFVAFVSSPKVEDRHPRRIVLNAVKRRGGRIAKTNGFSKIYYGGFPVRPGYVDADEVLFSIQVEEYD